MLSALNRALWYPTEDSESREVKITNPCWQSRWRKWKQNLQVIQHPPYSTNNHNPLPPACGTGLQAPTGHTAPHTHMGPWPQEQVCLPLATWKTQHLIWLHLSPAFLQINYVFVASFGLFKSRLLQSRAGLLFYHKVKLLSKYDHNLGWCLHCSFVLQ